jgi:hypothetical protein
MKKSKETKLLRRLDEFEDILKKTKELIILAGNISDPALKTERLNRLSKLQGDAEEGLAEERQRWNDFILKERTPKRYTMKRLTDPWTGKTVKY